MNEKLMFTNVPLKDEERSTQRCGVASTTYGPCVLTLGHSGDHKFQPVVSKPTGHDVVNSPAHYTFGKYEVIDILEDWQLGFHLGNAVKYIARAGRKDPAKLLEDLEKARWYLDRYITMLQEQAREQEAK